MCRSLVEIWKKDKDGITRRIGWTYKAYPYEGGNHKDNKDEKENL